MNGPRQSYATATANALQPHAFRAGSATRAEDGTATITENGGWPSYVAKAVLGTVRLAEDGSAGSAGDEPASGGAEQAPPAGTVRVWLGQRWASDT